MMKGQLVEVFQMLFKKDNSSCYYLFCPNAFTEITTILFYLSWSYYTAGSWGFTKHYLLIYSEAFKSHEQTSSNKGSGGT